MDIGRPHDALAACRDFLTRHPGESTVIWNMSLCLLLLGDFANGWRAYEHRFDIQDHDKRPEGGTVLDITQVTGKRVLILSEQGRGDMLHCIRYAPLLAERGAIISVQTYPDLLPLLAAMPGVTAAVSTDDSAAASRSYHLSHEPSAGLRYEPRQRALSARAGRPANVSTRTTPPSANWPRLVRLPTQL